MRPAACSAMASTVAFGWALGMTGVTDASATRSPVIPWTCSSRVDDRARVRAGTDPAGAGRVVVAADRAADPFPQFAGAGPGAGPCLGHAEPGEGGACCSLADYGQARLQPLHVAAFTQEAGIDQRCVQRAGGGQPDRPPAVRGDSGGHQGEASGRGLKARRGDGQQDREQVQVRPVACQRAG